MNIEKIASAVFAFLLTVMSLIFKAANAVTEFLDLGMIASAIFRKIVFMILIASFFKFADNYYFKAFDTDEELKGHPNAIAILLGLVTIALALA